MYFLAQSSFFSIALLTHISSGLWCSNLLHRWSKSLLKEKFRQLITIPWGPWWTRAKHTVRTRSRRLTHSNSLVNSNSIIKFNRTFFSSCFNNGCQREDSKIKILKEARKDQLLIRAWRHWIWKMSVKKRSSNWMTNHSICSQSIS